MKIIDVKQGSDSWLKARLGKVTASEIDALVTAKGAVKEGQGPKTYLYTKIAEKVLGMPVTDAGSFAIEQGSLIELEAVPWYSFSRNVEVQRVGFCVSDCERYGFSPDGLLGEEGGLEVKGPQPAKMMEYLLEGVVPELYTLQLQMSLFISKRKFWDFLAYSTRLPPLVVRAEPIEKLQSAIGEALAKFSVSFDAKLAQVARMKAEHENPLKEAYEAKIKRWEETGEIP